MDLFVGGTATASAKFAITNINNGTPTASVSAGTNGGLYVTADGTLATTAKQALTIGSASTGNIILNGFGAGVVHTNASGLISSSAVNLAGSDVTGTLPVGNGGTGTTSFTSNGLLYGNGSGAVQVTAAGTNGTVLHGNTGGAPTFSAVSLTADVSGILPLANGGTNANLTAANGAIAYSNASALALSAVGTSGQCLLSGGAGTPIWGNCTTGGGTNFWTSTNGSLYPINATMDLLVGGTATASAKFAVTNINSGTPNASVSAGTNGGLYVTADGTLATTAKQTLTIGSSTTGNVAINGFSTGLVHANSSGILSSSAVNLAGADVTGTLGVGNGGTGGTSFTSNGVILGNTSGAFNVTAAGTANQVFRVPGGGGAPAFGAIDISQSAAVTGILPLANGGTNANLTAVNGGVVYSGASALAISAAGTSGQCLLSSGAGTPTWGNCTTGGGTNFWTSTNGSLYPINSTMDLFVGGTATASAKFAVTNINSGTPTASVSAGTNGGLYVTADGTLATTAKQTLTIGSSSTGNVVLSGFGTGLVHTNASGVLTSSAVNLAGSDITGTLPVGNGGTGGTSFTSNGLLYGNGSGVVQVTAAGTNGTVLHGNTGGAPTFSAVSLTADISGILPLANGGTNANLTAANGAIAYSNASALALSAVGTSGQCLLSSGAGTPTWGNCTTGGGTNFWTSTNGSLYPINATMDLFVGGTATASAKFAVTNINSGTPNASVSAGTNGSLYVTADGTLATTAKQTLTLGSASTGNVAINGFSTGLVHANASGILSSSAVNLASADVTGTLAIGNGGTGATSFTSNGVVLGNGSGALAVTAAGTANQVFRVPGGGGAPAFGAIDISQSAAVTGILPLANGGTNANLTAANGAIAYSNASALALSSVGTSGQCLLSGGAGTPTWGNCTAGGGTNFWTSTNGSLYPINSTMDLFVGGTATASAKFAVTNINSGTPTASVSAGTNGGLYVTADGTLATTAKQTLTIGSSTTGNVVLSGFGAGVVHTSASGVISTSAVNLAGSDVTGTLPVGNGGTGTTSLTSNGLLYGNGSGAVQVTSAGTNGTLLHGNTGGAPTFSAVSLTADVSGILPLANGGTNANLTAANGAITYSNASALALSSVGTSGQCLLSGGAGTPTWGNCATGGGTNLWATTNGAIYPINSTEDLFVGGTATASAKFAVLNVNSGTPTASVSAGTNGGLYVTADGTLATTAKQTLTLGSASTGNVAINGFSTGLVHANASGVLSSSAVNLASADITGTLAVGNGGTGATSFTSNGVIYGNGSSLLQVTAAGTNGTVLHGNTGGAPTFSAVSLTADVSGILPLANGGTNANLTAANGAIAYSNASALALSSVGTSGQCLVSGGAGTPTWGNCTTGGGTNYWTSTNGSLYPVNSTMDLFVGGTATTSAKFAVLNVNSGTTTASVSAGTAALVLGGDGTIQSVRNNTLTVGGNTTGDMQFKPGNSSSSLYLSSGGNVGIGTTAPASIFDVRGADSSTDPIANALTGSGITITNTNSTSGNYSGIEFKNNSLQRMAALYAVRDSSGRASSLRFATSDSSAPVERMRIDSNGNVGINATSPVGTFDVRANSGTLSVASVSGATSFAGLVVDNSGKGDIFTASSSGLSRFVITQNGNVGIGKTNPTATLDITGSLKTSGTNTFSALSTGIGHLDSSGVLSSSAVNLANADVTGILPLANGGTNANLTAANGAIAYSNASALALSSVGTSGQCLLSGGAGTPTWGNCATGGGTNLWATTNAAIYPINSTEDLFVGGTATTSAKFAVLNVNNGTPTASLSAGTSGGAYLTAGGTLQTTANQTLTLGGNTTGNVILNPNANVGIGTANPSQKLESNGNIYINSAGTALNMISRGATSNFAGFQFLTAGTPKWTLGTRNDSTENMYLYDEVTGRIGLSMQSNTDYLGIGPINTSPLATLDVRPESGTLAVASVSGATSFAGLVVDNSGKGDIFTASSSGLNRFVIKQNGNVGIGTAFVADDGNGSGGGSGVSMLSVSNTTSGKYTHLLIDGPAGNGGEALTLTANGTTKSELVHDTSAGDLELNNRTAGEGINLQTFSGSLTTKLGIANSGAITMSNYGTGIAHFSSAGLISSSAINLANADVTGILPLANGGTNANLTAVNGGVVYSGASALAISGAGVNGQCLLSGGAGAPTWGNCTSATSMWTSTNGALYPVNSTLDLLVGGTATTSAKFAVLNVNSGTPTASVSAGTAALTLAGDGTIQSVRNNTLTVGGSTTGNIILNPVNGNGNVGIDTNNPQDPLDVNGNIRITASSGGYFYNADSTAKVKALYNGAGDWLGLQSDSSNVFSFSDKGVASNSLGTSVLSFKLNGSGGNVGINTTNPSGKLDVEGGDFNVGGVGGQLTLRATGGAIDMISTSPVYFNNGVNENIYLVPSSPAFVGVGTSNPNATLDVQSNNGTLAVASVSGKTSFAGLVVDNSGRGDLFTASSSGLSRFVISQNGNVGIGTRTTTAQLDITSSTANNDALSIYSPNRGKSLDLGYDGSNVVIGASGQSITFGSALFNAGGTFDNGSNTLNDVNQLGVGTTNQLATTDLRATSGTIATASVSGSTSLAGLVVDNSGRGDIFTASSSGLNRFVVTQNGNVGVGTAAPKSLFDVEGGNIMIGQQTNTSVATDQTWSKVTQATAGTIANGGTAAIASISASAVYNGSLYVGTYQNIAGGAEVYRYDGVSGTWTKVSQSTAGTIANGGTANIGSVSAMTTFNGYLYIGTSKKDAAEVYRYDGSTNWTKVSGTTGTVGGGATTNIDSISSMAVYNGHFLVGTSEPGKAELYQYSGGTAWLSVGGVAGNPCQATSADSVTALAVSNNYLFIASAKGNAQAELCRVTYSFHTDMVGGGTPGTFTIYNSGTNANVAGLSVITQLLDYNGKLVIAFRKKGGGADLFLYDPPQANPSPAINAYYRLNNSAGSVNGVTTGLESISSMALYNGKLYVGTEKTGGAEIYRYEGGYDTSSLWTKVSQSTAGTIASGGTASINMISTLIPYNGSLYAGTFISGKAEVYQFTAVSDQSFALQFHAANSQASGEQNGVLSVGSISYVASSSAMSNGSFIFDHGIQTNTGAYDYAEDYATRDTSLNAGDIVALDPSENNMVKKATPGDSLVGVYSSNPGFELGQKDTTINGGRAIPVALTGRVTMNVSTESGAIKIGDLLATSSQPGIAMKATKAGFIIGKAMEPYDGEGVGKIMTYVNVTWADPSVQLTSSGDLNIASSLSPVIPSSTTPTLFGDSVATSSASLSGTLSDTVSLLQTQYASLSAKMTTIDDLTQKVATLEKDIPLFAASSSGMLGNNNATISGQLNVAGKSLFNDVGITGKVSMGLLSIDGMDTTDATPAATINTLSAPLKIQSLALAGVDFENGKVTIDTDGNIVTQGTIKAKEVSTEQLTVEENKDNQNNSTIGTSILKAGAVKVIVPAHKVTTTARVFLTPRTKTGGQSLIVSDINDGKSFTVEIEKPIVSDIKFDWWIVK